MRRTENKTIREWLVVTTIVAVVEAMVITALVTLLVTGGA
jgi:hypothetical protein